MVDAQEFFVILSIGFPGYRNGRMVLVVLRDPTLSRPSSPFPFCCLSGARGKRGEQAVPVPVKFSNSQPSASRLQSPTSEPRVHPPARNPPSHSKPPAGCIFGPGWRGVLCRTYWVWSLHFPA
ncbi:hypothetical protein EJ06DRAFT_9918 [Trichodelitschia bisporula]|uniref:Uncharacterized protein n=1 Tax=Trichodelitschia bisporula TaxID=703511 RepID=A0A6G1IAF3_9PEZI|nr:hypothetical protein EJ06DRAFT_9918 [Trichodelitschia bisporula]